MKASKTELLSLFKQAFEGCGFDGSACESAADLVVWSQMHGQPGFDVIAAKLANLSAMQRPDIQFLVDRNHEIEIDVGGASTLLCAELVSDVVVARAKVSGYCAAAILNCHERPLIVRQLVQNRGRGLHGLACWRDSLDPALMRAARVQPGRCCPEILSVLGADNDCASNKLPPAQALVLVYSSTAGPLNGYVSDHCPWLAGEIRERTTPGSIGACYQQAISDGIEISDELWQSLLLLASNMLVESSEESRRGAGA